MMRTTHHGGFLLVEGDYDSQFWSPRIDLTAYQIVNCGGKPNLLGAAALLDVRGDQTSIAVADSDFDRVLASSVASSRVCTTDDHDLDVYLVRSNALRKVMFEIAEPAEFQRLEVTKGRTLSDLAADVALHFGQLRLLNHVRHYQVDFDKLTPYRYVNPSDWTLDVNELHKDFCIKSGVSHAVLPHAITTLPIGAPSDMVQGHDLLRVLDIGLKGLLKGKRACGERELRSRLRLALEQADLAQSAMHQSITSVIQRFGLPSLLIT